MVYKSVAKIGDLDITLVIPVVYVFPVTGTWTVFGSGGISFGSTAPGPEPVFNIMINIGVGTQLRLEFLIQGVGHHISFHSTLMAALELRI